MIHTGQPWLTLLTKNQKYGVKPAFWHLKSFIVQDDTLGDAVVAVNTVRVQLDV